MTTDLSTKDADPGSETDRSLVPSWFLPSTIWLGIVAATFAISAVLIFTSGFLGLDGLARWLVGALAAVIAVAAAIGVRDFLARRHRGRAIGVILNYLIAVGFGFAALQNMGVFIGLDAVGDRFRDGVWILIVVAIGWLMATQADRFGSLAEQMRRAGRWVAGIAGAALIIQVGLIPGLIEFFVRLIEPDVLIPFLIAVAGGVGFWLLRRDDATLVFGTTYDQAEALDGFLFASPNVIGFLAFFAGPLLFSLYVSFTSWDGLTDLQWVGMDNYARIFGLQFTSVGDGQAVADVLKTNYQELIRWGDFVIAARDRLFWVGLRNIFVFAVVAVPLSVFPALVLAAFLNQKLPGVKFFRAVYFIPSVAGVVGISLIWKQLFNATVGAINYGILRLWDFINLLPGADFAPPQPEWLSNARVTLFSVVIVFAWQTLGFNAVLYLAGMQGISSSLYEAASIDGAGTWSKFWRITVPMLRPTTLFVVATTTILALQLFNELFILFSPQLQPSGPNNSTLTPVVQLYQEGFQRFNQGFASALAWVLFAIIFAITILYFRRQREDGGVG